MRHKTLMTFIGTVTVGLDLFIFTNCYLISTLYPICARCHDYDTPGVKMTFSVVGMKILDIQKVAKIFQF